MKAKVIRTFIDKYTMKSIKKGVEIEISEARFSELTTGPRGIFVEEILEAPPKESNSDEVPPTDLNSDELLKETQSPEEEEVPGEEKQPTKKNSKK